MTGEIREPITLIVGHGNASDLFYENKDLKYVRVLPACRYSDVGSRGLSPVELNEAVQMWMNRKHFGNPETEIQELKHQIKEMHDHYLGVIRDVNLNAHNEKRELSKKIAQMECQTFQLEKVIADLKSHNCNLVKRIVHYQERDEFSQKCIKQLEEEIKNHKPEKHCECCAESPHQYTLKDNDYEYKVCANCLPALVNTALSPTQFFNLIRNGHTTKEHLLHGDFYDDETGEALQPR